jgi:hypothetical protein
MGAQLMLVRFNTLGQHQFSMRCTRAIIGTLLALQQTSALADRVGTMSFRSQDDGSYAD